MNNYIFPYNNGLAVAKKDKLCISIINSDGQKQISCKKIKSHKLLKIPFLRGIAYLFVGIKLYIKSIIEEEKLNTRPAQEQNRTYKKSLNYNFISNFLMLFASMLLSFILGFVVLSFVPNFTVEKLIGKENYYLKAFIVASFRTILVYLYFLALRFFPFMQGFYKFNRAGQEKFNQSVKKDNVNFLNFVINLCLVSTFFVSLIAVNISWIVNFVLNVLLLIGFSSLVYEILLFCASTKNSFVKDLSFITMWLTFIKPNTTQLEVVNMAFLEIENTVESFEYGKDQIALSNVFAEMQTKLKSHEKCEKSDIDWIVANVLNKSRAEIKLEKSVTKEQYNKIMSYTLRRAKGEPLSSIFGFVEFYGLKIEVNKKVLTPRFETEILVEKVLKKIKDKKAELVLDLCTGSGAIAIALAKFSKAEIWASDVSKQALTVAQNNAKNNNVKVNFIESNLFENFKKNKKFDIIVSNPPYVKSEDVEKLEVEVKNYDPKLALDGGLDGYDFYRKIIFSASSYLKQGGFLFFEVGQGQAREVAKLLKNYNFVDIEIINDYNKIERIVYGRIN